MLDGFPCRIVGILPGDFQIATLDADVWEPHTSHGSPRGPETWFVVGRLKPAVTVEQAQAEMSTIARRLNDRLPAAERNRDVRVVPLSLYMVGPQSRLALWILGGTVFCVFLIAAANVTSLSLARSVVRAREMAVRAALGGSRQRMVRQLLTESLMLALAGGVLGVALAFASLRLILLLVPPNTIPDESEVALNLPVLLFALAVAMQEVKRLRRRPDTDRQLEISAAWAPWRSVAARLLWHHYLTTRRTRVR